MPRLGHGRVITQNDIEDSRTELAEAAIRSPAAFSIARQVEAHNFDFLFPELQEDEANLLPQQGNMPELLKNLGASMVDATEEDSPIPAAYTYFGQFVDHDITLEIQQGHGSATMDQLLDPNMTPLGATEIRNALLNARTPTLDLDNVYGLPAPHDPQNGDKMKLGFNSPTQNAGVKPNTLPPGKTLDNDLPREGPNPGNIEHDRAAVIGDPRNDENTIISQLQVAFLKAHNALVDQGLPFDMARRALRQHYQHVIVYDFLKRVCDPAIVDDIAANGNSWYDPASEPLFMPLEFSVAGYRFGHSMVRGAYNFNDNFNFSGEQGTFPASLEFLFTFSALSGQLGNFDTLPQNWIIQWENIIGDSGTKARMIDTRLAAIGDKALFALKSLTGQTEQPPDAARLAVRNLLRGYRLRLPTGQAVAQALGLPALSKDDILAVAANPAQHSAIEAGGFETRTPLWFYVLAEAKRNGEGKHLGPVGSTLVAEVLIGLVRRSEDSILTQPGWQPYLPSATPGTFELADILRLAGVLGGGRAPANPISYTVRSGDTLSGIAQAQLGDANRWTQIYVLNRAIIRNPNQISVGQVFILPVKTPVGTIPKVHTVRAGDTLFDIAAAKLGNSNRWPDIWMANVTLIPNPNRLVTGQVLVLPF
ncbi:LysM peptidoglycan-binding domain-containing protein [Actinoplanes sp. TBRC 11911]|uniref:LysM peptidoglycan-binding domain-containing protein n=1 Tax=Actinoplanes sp. TBRC 11911 TaxID=2729386 RepID=UPI00145E0E5C|nr:LysM peptidoglycan-binding domain-containing protein [Actinoplanes sp. TBRC 11911]NMO52394.1 LysM peptidoglycan-binding domain-containing protein [Actinoplanes sp. TBRC 11911]